MDEKHMRSGDGPPDLIGDELERDFRALYEPPIQVQTHFSQPGARTLSLAAIAALVFWCAAIVVGLVVVGVWP